MAWNAASAQESALGYRLNGLDLVVFNDLSTHVESTYSETASLGWDFARTDTLSTDEEADEEQGYSLGRVALVGGVATGAILAVTESQRRRWWVDRSPTFRFQEDWNYVRWSDKFGHFFSSSFYSRVYLTSLEWAGLPEAKAELWAAGMAWTNMFYYEFLDGFGPQWGFSTGDLLFNTAGVGFTYAQWQIPELEPYTLKVSYWPSGWEGKNPTDDYAGQTWWATANLHSALPESIGGSIPPWLNLAVGYGARDRDERDFLQTSYVYLGVDLELTALPIDHPVWNAVVKWVRYLHIPAPAIRITPDPAFVPFAY